MIDVIETWDSLKNSFTLQDLLQCAEWPFCDLLWLHLLSLYLVLVHLPSESLGWWAWVARGWQLALLPADCCPALPNLFQAGRIHGLATGPGLIQAEMLYISVKDFSSLQSTTSPHSTPVWSWCSFVYEHVLYSQSPQKRLDRKSVV